MTDIPANGPNEPTPQPVTHETHVHENHTHVDASANRQLYVMIGALLVGGGLGMVAWGVWHSNPTLAESAASGLALYISLFVTALFKKGVIALPRSDAESLPFIKDGIRTGWKEIQEFIARSNTLVLMLIVLSQVIVWLVLRLAVWNAMGIFNNIWVAGGVTALVISPFVIPGALATIGRALRNHKRSA